jgi:DNA-binding MarR family transcriptional regulator
LQPATESPAASEQACARALLDVVPLVMRVIRQHLVRHPSGLSVPQFRTLCYVSAARGSSLSAAADFIGLSAPAMSRLVDGLVEVGMIRRVVCPDDRRHVKLSVTPKGDAALREARTLAQAELAEAVRSLKAGERADIVEAMRLLQGVFGPEANSDEPVEVAAKGRR